MINNELNQALLFRVILKWVHESDPFSHCPGKRAGAEIKMAGGKRDFFSTKGEMVSYFFIRFFSERIKKTDGDFRGNK
jgi:hypothetical protein